MWLHVNADHNGSIMRFDCPQCPCTYASKCGLNRHVHLIHEKLSRYQCETCGKGVTDGLEIESVLGKFEKTIYNDI